MSPGHEHQIEILFLAVGVLFTVIFGVIFYNVFKNARREDSNALSHEAKREVPTMAPQEEDEREILSHIDSTGEVVSDIEAVDLTVDLKEALRKTEENLFGRIRSLFKAQPEAKPLDEIEEILYTSDLGPITVQRLMKALEEKLSKKERCDYDKIGRAHV